MSKDHENIVVITNNKKKSMQSMTPIANSKTLGLQSTIRLKRCG